MRKKDYLKRRNLRRESPLIVVIVCEGRLAEPNYFRNYRDRGNGLKIKIPNSTFTDPVNLVRFAINQKEKFDSDRVWCVFDADHHKEEEFRKAGLKASKSGIDICFSNPSFEIWYLLHFVYYESKIETKTIDSKLKRYVPNYEKNKDCFSELLGRRGNAIRNARKLKETHVNDGTELLSRNSNPSTQVFELVEYLLRTVKKN